MDRLLLAARSLTGISVGDAFGESFFGPAAEIERAIQERIIPQNSWLFTDDTIMAIALYRSLEQYGCIDPDYVAGIFLEQYRQDTYRGYGPSMHRFFREMEEGMHWSVLTKDRFDGSGSMGNGGAMRAALIGAYFYDDLHQVKEQAAIACTITHNHTEAICGAMAVALACALATRQHLGTTVYDRDTFLESIVVMLPESDTRSKIGKACTMKGAFSMQTLAAVLGNGERMLAQDTVPLALWVAARYLTDLESCLWQMVAGLGDRDTLCAIAAGIVMMSAEDASIPEAWLERVESWRESRFMNP